MKTMTNKHGEARAIRAANGNCRVLYHDELGRAWLLQPQLGEVVDEREMCTPTHIRRFVPAYKSTRHDAVYIYRDGWQPLEITEN